MLKFAQGNLQGLEFASERLRDNKEFALAVIEWEVSEHLQHLSPRLRDDLDVALRAPCLQLISERLRDNKELALTAVKADKNQLEFVSERLRYDLDIMATVLGVPGGLEVLRAHCPQFPPDNKQEMLCLIRSAPHYSLCSLFESRSPRLQDDLDLTRDTMKGLIKRASESEYYRSHYLKSAFRVFASASPHLQTRPELVELFVEVHAVDAYCIAHFLTDGLRDCKEFMMELVRLVPCCFRLASVWLRGDSELLSRAVEGDPGNVVYVEPERSEGDEKRQRVV